MKMRKIKIAAVSILVLLAALFLVVSFALGGIIKKSASALAPVIIGAPVEIKTARVYPLSGIVHVGGVVVGAPEGYKANLAELGDFKLDFSLRSVFTDTVRIKEIIIKDPIVTYEISGLHSNIGAVMEKVSGDEKETAEEEETKSPGKKVVIDHFLFEGGKVRLAATITGGKGVVLPLPKIELRDIGKDKNGVETVEAVGMMVYAVSVAVFTTVRDGIIGIAGLGVDAVEVIGKTAYTGLSYAADAGVIAAKAVGKAAVAVGGAVASGAKAVVTLGGLIGGDDDGASESNAVQTADSPVQEPAGTEGSAE